MSSMLQFKPPHKTTRGEEHIYSQDKFVVQTVYANGKIEEDLIPAVALINSATLGKIGVPYGIFRSPLTQQEKVLSRQAIIPIKYSLNRYKRGHLVVRYYTYDYSASVPTEHIEEIHYVVPDGSKIFFTN